MPLLYSGEPIFQITDPNGRPVTGRFFKNSVLNVLKGVKVKKIYQ